MDTSVPPFEPTFDLTPLLDLPLGSREFEAHMAHLRASYLGVANRFMDEEYPGLPDQGKIVEDAVSASMLSVTKARTMVSSYTLDDRAKRRWLEISGSLITRNLSNTLMLLAMRSDE